MNRTSISLLLLLLVSTACAQDDTGPSDEQREERELAARHACIAQRLAQVAAEELRTLESLSAALGPVGFQQAYTQHADLRHTVYAAHDSALNHSASSQDSARHAAAAAIQIRTPEPGSVEENVIRSYDSKFAAIFNDPDDRCNWEAELQRED